MLVTTGEYGFGNPPNLVAALLSLTFVVPSAIGDPPQLRFVPYRQSPDSAEVLLLDVPTAQPPAKGDHVVVFHDDQCVAIGAIRSSNNEDIRAELDWLEWNLPATGTALIVPGDLPERLMRSLPPAIFATKIQQAGATKIAQVMRSVQTENRNLAMIRQIDGQRFGLSDRIDFYRTGQYAGFGTVVDVTPNHAMVEIMTSLSPHPIIGSGHFGIRRAQAGSNPNVRGYVFRLEADYALVSLGEADGIEVGRQLFARSRSGQFYQLTVKHVYRDHCGARLNQMKDSAPPNLWDAVGLKPGFAVAIELDAEQWKTVGVDWLLTIAACPEGVCTRDGDFVYCRERTLGVGVVLLSHHDKKVVFVSGEWTVSPMATAGEEHVDPSAVDSGVVQPTTQAVDAAGGL